VCNGLPLHANLLFFCASHAAVEGRRFRTPPGEGKREERPSGAIFARFLSLRLTRSSSKLLRARLTATGERLMWIERFWRVS
jgi:hypothetical protein